MWDDKTVQELKRLWQTGNYTAREIAEKLGTGFTRNSCIGKIHRLGLSKVKKTDGNTSTTSEVDKSKVRKSKRNKFKSLLIEKNFEPARNLTLEELTEETCKYMEHDMHPNDPHATFCGRKTINNSKQKFSYCPLHLMIIFQPKNKKEDVVNKDDEVPQFIEKKIKSA